MSAFWLQPAAWWGLLSLVIPVLIHLLARDQSRRLLFPSLKFLRTTRLAALRRRIISDWPLLVVRVLILALAAGALAAPVFVSAARRQAWNMRIARAIVMVPESIGSQSTNQEVARITADERNAAFVSAVFTPSGTLGDGLRDAAMWLEGQPPAAREVVVIGDLRYGSLAGADLDLVPRNMGLRFLPVASARADRSSRLRAFADAEGATRPHDLHLSLDDRRTSVEHQLIDSLEQVPVDVRAAPEDQPRTEAAMRVVLAEGLVLHRDRDRRVTIEFDGAPNPDRRAVVQPARQAWMRRVLEQMPDVRGGEAEGRLIVRIGMRGADPRALHAIARVTRTAFADDLRDLEPSVIPPSTLAGWSRPTGPVADDLRPGDEGDRRYIWLMVLILLGVEHWIRRSGRVSQDSGSGRDAEARVA